MNVDLNQFYDTLAEELAGTLWRTSFEKKGFAQYYFWCPYTKTKHPGGRKPKLSINFQLNRFNCWVCPYKGIASKLLNERGILDATGRREIYEKNKLESPTGDVEIYAPKTFKIPKHVLITRENYQGETKRAYEYITKRLECSLDFVEDFELGVSKDVFLKNKKGEEYTKNSFCIFIPSFDQNLRMNYYFQREFMLRQSEKYNPISEKSKVIIFESRIDWNKKDLVLVEGGFDSLRLWSLGIQNVPLIGNSLSKKSLLFQYIRMYDIDPIILLDQDARHNAECIKDFLQSVGIKSSVWHTLYDSVEKEYPEKMRGTLDPAILKKKHLMRLKEHFDV